MSEPLAPLSREQNRGGASRWRRIASIWIVALTLTGCAVGGYSSDHMPTSPPATVSVAAGFTIAPLVTGLSQPTALAYGPDGRLYIAQRSGTVLATDGIAPPQPYVTGLTKPLGLSWVGGALYVVQQGSIRHVLDSDADGQADQQRDLVLDLPDKAESTTIATGADGWLYVGVGTHADHTATAGVLEGSILRFRPDGTESEVYATGLRMPFGLAFDSDQQLYATENGREGLGADIPPDEINHIRPGADYGWPRCWGQRHEDAQGSGTAALCAQTEAPVAELPAHAGAAALVFYTADAFPATYQGDGFVALSGSWYTDEARGHSVVRMHGPSREIIPFASGFGRPVGLAVGPEGQLLVADYDRGIVYAIVAAS